MSTSDRPFRVLGWQLKLAREQLSESVAEVSGAVEIETEFLEKIEQGTARPSEDVLLLLINHFGIADAEATSLWEMAGYTPDSKPVDDTVKSIDPRIIYTDMVHVVINDSGVVMNFLQANGLGNQPLAVSRVGMSKDQANHMLKMLEQSLDNPQPQAPKSLPAKTSRPKKIKKNHKKS